jgi:hypothetical protein
MARATLSFLLIAVFRKELRRISADLSSARLLQDINRLLEGPANHGCLPKQSEVGTKLDRGLRLLIPSPLLNLIAEGDITDCLS